VAERPSALVDENKRIKEELAKLQAEFQDVNQELVARREADKEAQAKKDAQQENRVDNEVNLS
jgi:hypothetical protein